MPYITQEARKKLEDNGNKPENLGELNYVITLLIKYYLDKQGRRYMHYAGVIGVLETIILELYRRDAAPYEEEKIKENGDVY